MIAAYSTPARATRAWQPVSSQETLAMLSLVDRSSGCNRREFLRIGGLSLGGLTLADLLAVRGMAASNAHFVTGKSVIFLYQHGGPSQFETFDPKMTAPNGIRSVTGETATTVPGVTFGGTMTRTAQQAHRLAIVRSYQSGSSAHGIRPVVGEDTLDANIGSIYSRVVGAADRQTGMPTNVAIFPNAVDPQGPGPSDSFGKFASSGMLGTSYAPFVPGTGGQLQQNMMLNISRERLDDRRSLLSGVDRIRRSIDASGALEGLDGLQSQAFQVILGGVADAFDLSKEDPRTIARYDTAAYVRSAQWQYKNNRSHYTAHANSLGKLLLLARRLCEAGCGFVTVNTAFVWDMHADVNNLGVDEGMDFVGTPFDHAVAAFVEDVAARGQSDKILLVATGEMGRTPKVNNGAGRDHWGKLTPLLLSGGGIQGGQVIGQSTRDGGEPLSEPITSKHLVSTIMHTVFDVGQLRLARGIPNDVARVITSGEPIPGLVS
jgi:hypothetical protein